MPLAQIVVETNEDAFNTAVHDEWDHQTYNNIKNISKLFVYKGGGLVSGACLVMGQKQYPVTNFEEYGIEFNNNRQAIILGGTNEIIEILRHCTSVSLKEHSEQGTPQDRVEAGSGALRVYLEENEKPYQDVGAEAWLTKSGFPVIKPGEVYNPARKVNEFFAISMPFAYREKQGGKVSTLARAAESALA